SSAVLFVLLLSFFLPMPPLPTSTLFPYTTLFRSLNYQTVQRRLSTYFVKKGDASQSHYIVTGYDLKKILVEANYDSAYEQDISRSEEHTSELQSRFDLVCRLLLEKKNKYKI